MKIRERIMMKKVFLILAIMITITGCKRNTTSIEFGKTYTVDNKIQLEIMKTETVEVIEPSNKNNSTKQIEAKNDYQFIDLLVTTTNLTDEQLELKDIFTGQIIIDNTSYTINAVLESTQYTTLTTTDTLKSNEERYVHLYCEVPKSIESTDAKLTLTVLNTQQYNYEFSIENLEEKENTQHSIGDILALQQTKIAISQINHSSRIEPSNKGIFYSYIPTDSDDEIFMYLKINIENISQETIQINDYLYCEYIVGSQSYETKFIAESENHKSLRSISKLEATENRDIYVAATVKNKSDNKNGYFKLFIEGQTYEIEK
jgi:hypothetical protein